MTTPRDDIAGLIERLRDRTSLHAFKQLTFKHSYDYEAGRELLDEAATQLDALQARVKELGESRDLYAEHSMKEEDCRKMWQSRATRLQQERDEAYERAAKECSDYARWAEQQISEDDPVESSKSQLFATISNTADDCAEKVRDLVRRLAGPEKDRTP